MIGTFAFLAICVEGATRLSAGNNFINEMNNQKRFAEDPLLGSLMSSEELRPHPYFGFSSPVTEAERLKLEYQELTPEEFHVATVGGSVAQTFAFHIPQFAERLKKHLPALKDKKVIVHNFAFPSYKQPQQFFLVSTILHKLDLIISIDGFNEIALFHGRTFMPPTYPRFYHKSVDSKAGNLLYPMVAKYVRYLYKIINALPERINFFKQSYAYHFIWKRLRTLLYNQHRKLEELFIISLSKDFTTSFPGVENRAQEYASIWRRYTKYMHQLANGAGIKCITFLQPNQYVPNSKSFSLKEQQLGVINKDHAGLYIPGLLYLQKKASLLKTEGLTVVDLTDIFKKVTETVYVDDCCHINKYGNEIMAEAILHSIKANWPDLGS